MGDVVRGYAVVVEKPPAVFVANDAVVSGPTHNGLQQFAFEAEGTIGIVAHSQTEQVAVARRIGEEVLAVCLMHP